MIPAIITISLAMFWLGYETQWFTVRLLTGVIYPLPDIEYEFDGSDRPFLDDYELQAADRFDFPAYEDWLENERYKVTYRLGGFPDRPYTDNPQDKWMAIEEDLTARRNGEMLYQRG